MNHDDVISTRAVSFIIYLTDPDEPWTAEDGGALELYPLVEGEACLLIKKAVVRHTCSVRMIHIVGHAHDPHAHQWPYRSITWRCTGAVPTG